MNANEPVHLSVVGGGGGGRGELLSAIADCCARLGLSHEQAVVGAGGAAEAELNGRVVVCLSGPGERVAGELGGRLARPVLNVPVAGPGDDPLAVLREQADAGGAAGCLALGVAGAKNAVLAAAAILALDDAAIRRRLDGFRRDQTREVLATTLPDA